MLKDILIVDGYNVIFAWTHLKKLAHESLEHARMELRDRLLNYGKFKGYEVILVFDGKYTKSGGSIESITSGFIEVYTEDGETADSFIEREVFLRKGKYTNVYVVTSDGAEQNQILGSGGSVSYTHLDVYKRQVLRCYGKSKICILLSKLWG